MSGLVRGPPFIRRDGAEVIRHAGLQAFYVAGHVLRFGPGADVHGRQRLPVVRRRPVFEVVAGVETDRIDRGAEIGVRIGDGGCPNRRDPRAGGNGEGPVGRPRRSQRVLGDEPIVIRPAGLKAGEDGRIDRNRAGDRTGRNPCGLLRVDRRDPVFEAVFGVEPVWIQGAVKGGAAGVEIGGRIRGSVEDGSRFEGSILAVVLAVCAVDGEPVVVDPSDDEAGQIRADRGIARIGSGNVARRGVVVGFDRGAVFDVAVRRDGRIPDSDLGRDVSGRVPGGRRDVVDIRNRHRLAEDRNLAGARPLHVYPAVGRAAAAIEADRVKGGVVGDVAFGDRFTRARAGLPGHPSPPNIGPT